jgi:hypothetical protein
MGERTTTLAGSGHPNTELKIREQVSADIMAERLRQDVQWGGAAHDDTHSSDDWLRFIVKQLHRAADLSAGIEPAIPDAYREKLVKIGALAHAALEAHDRWILRQGTV